MSRVLAVCTSATKGVRKTDNRRGFFETNHGLVDDAHADGSSHRQVSLLAIESIDKMRSAGFDVSPGDFAENLTTEGVGLVSLPVGTRVSVGDEVILEITQIGKNCHTGCAIFQEVGKCIMPREGVFARVIRGGYIATGDSIEVV